MSAPTPSSSSTSPAPSDTNSTSTSTSSASSSTKSSTLSVLNLLPGVAHACTTVGIGYPFDTIKTRLQTGMYGRYLRYSIIRVRVFF